MTTRAPTCRCACGCAASVDPDGEGGYWPRCKGCEFRPNPRCTKASALIERRLAGMEERLARLEAQRQTEADPSAWLRVNVPPPFDPMAPLTDTERAYVTTGAVPKR